MKVDASPADAVLADRIRSRVASLDSGPFQLTVRNGRVLLHKAEAGGVCVETGDVARRIHRGGRSDLARACGARAGLRVLDAMAGYGIDGLVLASLGCRVWLVERSPIVYSLLENLVERWPGVLDGRVELRMGDGTECFLLAPFDVIYLDPMFVPRNKRALPNKRAQWLGELLVHQAGAIDPELVNRARHAALDRVVLKRRRTDPTELAPDWRIVGRSVRFDVYRSLR